MSEIRCSNVYYTKQTRMHWSKGGEGYDQHVCVYLTFSFVCVEVLAAGIPIPALPGVWASICSQGKTGESEKQTDRQRQRQRQRERVKQDRQTERQILCVNCYSSCD